MRKEKKKMIGKGDKVNVSDEVFVRANDQNYLEFFSQLSSQTRDLINLEIQIFRSGEYFIELSNLKIKWNTKIVGFEKDAVISLTQENSIFDYVYFSNITL
jgi:hypothetical protein